MYSGWNPCFISGFLKLHGEWIWVLIKYSLLPLKIDKYYDNIVAKRNIVYKSVITIVIIMFIIATDIIIWIKFDYYLYIPFVYTAIIYASCNFETFRFY